MTKKKPAPKPKKLTLAAAQKEIRSLRSKLGHETKKLCYEKALRIDSEEYRSKYYKECNDLHAKLEKLTKYSSQQQEAYGQRVDTCAANNKEIAKLKARVTELNTMYFDMEKRAQSVECKNFNQSQEIKAHELQAADQDAEINDLKAKVVALNADAANKITEMTAMKGVINQLKDKYVKQVDRYEHRDKQLQALHNHIKTVGNNAQLNEKAGKPPNYKDYFMGIYGYFLAQRDAR